MPIGIQRINAKKSQPNPQIMFIKPLKGPDEAIAQDFLERIAAQCLPIMKEHHISVMSVEEYEPNREFVGRNFNAGEVIQLVLKSPSTGRWLPFHYVQMVMMHELAHCNQMNHSRAFWAVRNKYANQMRGLWSKGYTGEGLWGRGTSLKTGEFETNTVLSDEILPEHLCGGTYRSRRRKRKAKDQLTYQERKERRILKKFGPNGVALGEDDDMKAELEKGRRTTARPRVAKSKRGRELRAAAALARFEKHKEEETPVKVEDNETASEDELDTASESEGESTEATDSNGKRLVDGKGNRLVKVCEDENPNDLDARQELQELQSSFSHAPTSKSLMSTFAKTRPPEIHHNADVMRPVKEEQRRSLVESSHSSTRLCSMCSFDNDVGSVTCAICSHVLDARRDQNCWRCRRSACKGSMFMNAGDSGACGVCGERKGYTD